MPDEIIAPELIIDQLYDGVCFVDLEGRITVWNRGAQRITGHARDCMLGKTLSSDILTHVDEHGTVLFEERPPLFMTLSDGQIREKELFLRHVDGHTIPVMVRISAIHSTTGEIIGAIEIFSDNSSKYLARQRIEELEALALVCPLTGVGNRRYGMLTITNAVEEYRRYGRRFGLLFIDIDRFKSINDEYGHAVGDDVLIMVSQALRASLRSIDFVARWGGEEFVAVLPNIAEDRLSAVAERCRLNVQESAIQHDGKVIHVTISIGGVIGAEDENADTCVDRADRLMYQSKSGGRNRVTLELA